VDTLRSVTGTNAQNHAVVVPRSARELAQHPPHSTVEKVVSSSAHPSNEERAKPNPVPDTQSSDPGPNAPRHALAVYRSEQGNVTPLDGEELWTAVILDRPTRRGCVRHNPVPSMETGELGLRGLLALKHVVRDPNPKPEFATTPDHSSAVPSAQDTTPFTPYVRLNHVPSMVGGLSGKSGDHAPRAVELDNKNEPVPVPTPPPNTEATHAQDRPWTDRTVTLTTALWMEGGHSGVCGESAPRHAEGDEPTGCDAAPPPSPNMVVSDALVPPSRRNNVERSNVRSTEGGTLTVPSVSAPRPVEVVTLWPTDTASTQHPNTTVFHVPVETASRKLATFSPVPSTASTHHGERGPIAHSLVVVAHRHEAEHAHHPNTEVSRALFSATPQTAVSATPSCVQSNSSTQRSHVKENSLR